LHLSVDAVLLLKRLANGVLRLLIAGGNHLPSLLLFDLPLEGLVDRLAFRAEVVGSTRLRSRLILQGVLNQVWLHRRQGFNKFLE